MPCAFLLRPDYPGADPNIAPTEAPDARYRRMDGGRATRTGDAANRVRTGLACVAGPAVCGEQETIPYCSMPDGWMAALPSVFGPAGGRKVRAPRRHGAG